MALQSQTEPTHFWMVASFDQDVLNAYATTAKHTGEDFKEWLEPVDLILLRAILVRHGIIPAPNPDIDTLVRVAEGFALLIAEHAS